MLVLLLLLFFFLPFERVDYTLHGKKICSLFGHDGYVPLSWAWLLGPWTGIL